VILFINLRHNLGLNFADLLLDLMAEDHSIYLKNICREKFAMYTFNVLNSIVKYLLCFFSTCQVQSYLMACIDGLLRWNYIWINKRQLKLHLQCLSFIVLEFLFLYMRMIIYSLDSGYFLNLRMSGLTKIRLRCIKYRQTWLLMYLPCIAFELCHLIMRRKKLGIFYIF